MTETREIEPLIKEIATLIGQKAKRKGCPLASRDAMMACWSVFIDECGHPGILEDFYKAYCKGYGNTKVPV